MDLVVSGTDEAILMVECGADGVTEAEVLDALDIAHERDQEDLRHDRGAAREGRQGEARGRGAQDRREPRRARSAPRTARSSTRRRRSTSKLERQDADRRRSRRRSSSSTRRPATARSPTASARAEVVARLRRAREGHRSASAIAVDKKRPDGRAQDEIRPIECEVDISPRVHGSALFTRGETQILSNVALGHDAAWTCGSTTSACRTTKTVLAPLQLPAVLGRGGRLHARPEAPRHRPRRARRAGAGRRRSRARRTSPT